MMINKLKINSMIMLALILASCNTNEVLTESQRTKALFNNMIEGNIDAAHTFKASVNLNVNVKTNNTTEIVAYSTYLEKTMIFDRKVISENGTVTLTVPQGYGKNVILLTNDGIHLQTSVVTLTGVPQQNVDVDCITRMSSSPAVSRAASAPSLYGTDITPNVGYIEMDIQKMLPILNNIQEGINADNSDAITNYELISNGPFNVSMLYGFTGCYTSCILGYYYHSPGTYSDLKFVDLTETHIYDYIDGKSKVQYQLNGDKSVWYDANYDYRDGFNPPYTTVQARLGDDAYNIEAVISHFGNQITAIRGLSYEINVPKDYRIGFYLKRVGIESSAQRESIVKKGIPSNLLPEKFTETNFGAMALNVDGKLRSFYYQKDDVTFMGMEDAGTNGDFDCNDVLFGVEAKLKSELPTPKLPDIDPIILEYDNLPWTIAYEDIRRNADFDYNDAVIRVIPNYETHKAEVYVCAAGSDSPIYLYYDGPKGDSLICEVHEALGGGTFINTTSSMAIIPPKLVATVDWPSNYTIANDAIRFYCQIKRGTCKDCEDYTSLNQDKGMMPQALLIPGKWNWPKEGVNITTSYTNFPDWSKDVTKMAFWNWYSYPNADTYVNQ